MTATDAIGGRAKNLVLAAMIFAVAMTFIDQTIVSIAAPSIQRELGLTSTGVQWAINAYLLSLAALFAFGGRLADTVGHRKMVTLGVIIFAGASAMCGLTPKGGLAQAWIVTFRVMQGVGGAIMFPAALAIVVQTFPLRERGKALALFFGIAGGLTAVGPILGGYLTAVDLAGDLLGEHPGRDHRAGPDRGVRSPRPSTGRRGWTTAALVLIAGGVALSVSASSSRRSGAGAMPARSACIVVGAALLVVLLLRRAAHRVAADAGAGSSGSGRSSVENLVLGISMLVFVPVFFFASEYAQISLGKSATETGLVPAVLLPRVRGRRPDRRADAGPRGAKRPVVIGCIVAAVGFYLWAGKVTDLDFGAPGLVHHPVRRRYGAHARPGQHRCGQPRLAAVLRRGHRHHPDGAQLRRQPGPRHPRQCARDRDALAADRLADGPGVPRAAADAKASDLSQQHGGNLDKIPHFFRLDFAYATRSVLMAMAGIMAVAAIVAVVGLKRGVQEEENLRSRGCGRAGLGRAGDRLRPG